VSASPRVLVIGGGLAGITAALDCAERGAAVTLLEVRRRLGGAAYSFERDGLTMDNGQHVFLRCCVAYRALLRRLGSEHEVFLQPRLRIPVLRPGHEPVTLERGPLPAPAHLSGALLRYRHLSPLERVRAGSAALALMRVDPADEGSDAVTFGDWLARHGQSQQAIGALWDLIALPTLNLPAAEASLALAAFVFRTGLLSSADAGDIGFHDGTLAATIGEPAAASLRAAGVDVRLGWRVERLERAGSGFEAHGRAGAPGEEAGEGSESDRQGTDGVHADAAIVALPHNRAETLLGPLLGADRARRPELMGSSPIVNLHVVYDRQVLDEPFAAGVKTPVQYLFDRSRAAGAPVGCQYLAVSLSGAEREMSMSVDALRELYTPALTALLPRARTARMERFQVTREHAATFRAAPGIGRLRPSARTPLPGLTLAGTWTATGWPATLEGAVMSGHAAGAIALEGL
jgi:squalene-associated FAD-dependent desaturase